MGVPAPASAGVGASDEVIVNEIVTGAQRSGATGGRCGRLLWALVEMATV